MDLRRVWIIIPIFLLISCAPQTNTARTNIPESSDPNPISTKQEGSSIPTNNPAQDAVESSDQEKWIKLARKDLAEQLKIQAEEIELVSFEYVTWADASLGCPQPGMFFIQLPIEGYRLILEFQGNAYAYHSDKEGNMLLCDLESSPSQKEKLNVDDGWPNQTRDKDVIIITPRSP